MLRVVEDEKLIKKYAARFVRSFKPLVDEKIPVRLGHQGASFSARVLWSKKAGIWFFSQTAKQVRYANAFGIGKPPAGSHLPIAAEINFPAAGIDRRTGGAFARDPLGNVFAVHRGVIGGGKKGIGKSFFEEQYRGVWSWMEDADLISQVAVIGRLDSSRFPLQAALFVRKIDQLKSAVQRSSQTQFDFPEIAFREELLGESSPPSKDDLSPRCEQDLVVGHLASLLERWKFKVGNDPNRDLFIAEPTGNKISHVFAVSADSKEQSILAAVARLIIGSDATEPPVTILVVPDHAVCRYAGDFERLHIRLIGFRLEQERIIFPDLGKIRLDLNTQL
ncbi:MAG: hypothetical protein R6W75_07185 [Smithellaceae bacterium]